MAVSGETTSDFFEASFCQMLRRCSAIPVSASKTSSHVELDKEAVKLQIPIPHETLSPTACDHILYQTLLSVMSAGNIPSNSCFLTEVIMFQNEIIWNPNFEWKILL